MIVGNDRSSRRFPSSSWPPANPLCQIARRGLSREGLAWFDNSPARGGYAHATTCPVIRMIPVAFVTTELQQKHALKGSFSLGETSKREADVQNHLGGRDACCGALVGWSGHPSVRDHQARGGTPAFGSRRSGDIDDVPAEFTGRDRVALSGPPPLVSHIALDLPCPKQGDMSWPQSPFWSCFLWASPSGTRTFGKRAVK